MDINDIKHLAVERIFLIPDASEGQLGYVWCDDPAPGEGMDPGEAVEYVRKDVHDTAVAEIERERDMHKAAEETQIALREKAEEREQAMVAHVEYLEHLDRLHRNVIVAIADDRFEDLDISFYRDDTQPLSPETSLARRDLIKQAEALDDAAEGFERQDRHFIAAQSLRKSAAYLRQQAEAKQ